MSGDDFVEMVWENGQILMRDRSGRTFKAREWRSRYALYPSNAQAEDGGNMHRKRARLETTYSTLKDTTSLDCRDSDLHFPDNDSSQTGYHSKSSSDLYQHLKLEANRSKGDDKNSTNPQINGRGPDNANFRPSNASSFHCQELDTLLGPREKNPRKTPESIAGLHISNSMEHDLNLNTKTGTVMNFSYLRPEVLLKASTPVLARVQEMKSSNDERPPLGSRNPRESTMIWQASGSKRSATGPENQPEKELTPPVAETQESLPHEQHPEAFCNTRINLHNSHDQLPDQTSSALAANTPKGKPAVTSFSVCSLEASNDPTYSLRTYEDHTEESEYHLSPPISIALRSCPTSLQKVGEPESCFKKQAPARSCGGGKRSRTTEVHSLSEKRHREKVKEKMRVLKGLIPNCDKVDKVSMLDEAIEYLKTLQLQLQIMSMGNNGAYHVPSTMLPAGMQHFMNAVPHLTYFSPMGAGMYMGMGCSPLYPPNSQVGATALPGITGNSNQLMHGFLGQPFPMPISDASFLPSLGRLSAGQSVRSGPACPLWSLPFTRIDQQDMLAHVHRYP
ncbi:transcription factor PIF3-like isoform X1 [Carya illinoinensis]|uniref:BHLH domain-containing protein n=1 Tax=Carya illinoinensis TaxID=32201 RepID=A0A8T1PPE7_CARIL|nr:transcription factor PIF3-like isoform X1 [Carya illinoinensis]KAG6644855.1 hypothetical protein CIPAW_08G081900 [Carya illinoinensis]